MSLKEIIRGFQAELQNKVQVHEEITRVARRLIFFSKHGIMAIHRGEMDAARAKVHQMEQMRTKLEELLGSNQELISGSVKVAYQEYAEAHILLSIVDAGRYPDPGTLAISAISYILGLADSVGEFRRRALTSLLDGNLAEAETCLHIMQEIYGELIALEDAYVLAPDLRRKCDIARRIIESTLGDIIMEARKHSLEQTLAAFEEKLQP